MAGDVSKERVCYFVNTMGYIIFAETKGIYMQKIEFIFPDFDYPDRFAGVYRMTLDDKWFYFGSTVYLWRRFRKWRTNIKIGFPKNNKIKNLLPHISKVSFEVMEIVANESMLKVREDLYIKKYWGNELLLNRAPSALSLKGIVYTPEEQEIMKSYGMACAKKVAKLKKDGTIDVIYESISEATRQNKLARTDIARVLKFNNRSTNGMIFRKVDDDFNIIEPPERISKRPPKKFKVKGISNPPKPVCQYDMQGNLIKIHDSIKLASKSIGQNDPGNMRRHLKGDGKSIGGFKFKYYQQ